jgi:hypothetical protein
MNIDVFYRQEIVPLVVVEVDHYQVNLLDDCLYINIQV